MTSPDEREPDVIDALFAYLDKGLDLFHGKVLRPILVVTRILAFSLIFLVLATVIIATALILFVRFSTTYFFDHRVWITDDVVGALLLTIGLLMWRKRRRAPLRK